MLKIKDNLDLKELEKVGIKNKGSWDNFRNFIFDVILIQGFEYEMDILFDLIKEGLVEKVEI